MPAKRLSYATSGIDLDRYDDFTGALGSLLRRTHGPRVLANEGGFAGLFRLDYNEKLFARNYRDPVLVACADGVGTKIRIAQDLGRYDTIGIDLVAMNVNDMIVEGAEPLFFLDYIAVHSVDKAVLLDIVKGIADGCRAAGCALLGGETAEMTDLYTKGDFDLGGFAVGVVELARATNPLRVAPGDVVIGLESDGLHSNGFTLVRQIVREAKLKLDQPVRELGDDRPLGEHLLDPTRIYVPSIVKLLNAYKVKKIVSGMAHITGGGLADNLARVLPDNVDAVISGRSWPVPPIFDYLRKKGNVTPSEMARVFNMGIGYCLIVRPAFAESVMQRLAKCGERPHLIGTIKAGKGRVVRKR